MTKDEIQEIRIEVTSNKELALSMTIHRDGTLGRQGSGAVPQTQPVVLGMTDGRYFRELMALVQDAVFQHAGVYDYNDKAGVQVEYGLAFLGAGESGDKNRPIVAFHISRGTETKDVHAIVKYIDAVASRAVANTNPWYEAALKGKRGAEVPGGI
jgi:hypothetical protein